MTHVKIGQTIADLVGNTPLVKLNRLTGENDADVYVKLEYFNPGSSVKDRIALAMIEKAEKEGKLQEGSTIIEPTSGNTGIGLAMIAAAKGYNAVLVMPDTMSSERRNLLRAYGADLVLTPGADGMKGAIEKAKQLEKENGWFLPQQFDNPANPEIHRLTTGPEIADAFEEAGMQVDAFVAGVGTGGTVSGVGSVLKERFPDVLIAALEPKESAVLSGEQAGPHKIQGIGAGFVPKVFDADVIDEIVQVKGDDAYEYARRAAKEEGVLGGVSSGAAIYAALQLAKRLGKGKNVVTLLPSNGERYLSTPLYRFED